MVSSSSSDRRRGYTRPRAGERPPPVALERARVTPPPIPLGRIATGAHRVGPARRLEGVRDESRLSRQPGTKGDSLEAKGEAARDRRAGVRYGSSGGGGPRPARGARNGRCSDGEDGPGAR